MFARSFFMGPQFIWQMPNHLSRNTSHVISICWGVRGKGIRRPGSQTSKGRPACLIACDCTNKRAFLLVESWLSQKLLWICQFWSGVGVKNQASLHISRWMGLAENFWGCRVLREWGKRWGKKQESRSLEQGLGALAETLGNGGRQVWEDTGRNP